MCCFGLGAHLWHVCLYYGLYCTILCEFVMPLWIQLPYVLVWIGCRFMAMCGCILVVLHKIVSICDAPVDSVFVCAGMDRVLICGHVWVYYGFIAQENANS